MNIWKLRISMLGTLAIIFGLSTLVFTLVMSLAGIFDLVTLGIFVVGFNIIQWLISPYIIGALYRAKELSRTDNEKLHKIVETLSEKSKISKPKLMLSQIKLPNAFAYGSPLTGNHVAVTRGLLDSLKEEEVEAVIGHELGHLKHRDVQVMMVVSFLPALFYYIGFSLMFSSMYRSRRNEGGNNAIIGIAFMIFSWILNLFILYLSRLREYYADRHSVSIVDDGAKNLSMGLARIVQSSSRIRGNKKGNNNNNSFKALFISDPDRATLDSIEVAKINKAQNEQRLIREILSRNPTFAEKLAETFSTHPNIIKRLKALQEIK